MAAQRWREAAGTGHSHGKPGRESAARRQGIEDGHERNLLRGGARRAGGASEAGKGSGNPRGLQSQARRGVTVSLRLGPGVALVVTGGGKMAFFHGARRWSARIVAVAAIAACGLAHAASTGQT